MYWNQVIFMEVLSIYCQYQKYKIAKVFDNCHILFIIWYIHNIRRKRSMENLKK